MIDSQAALKTQPADERRQIPLLRRRLGEGGSKLVGALNGTTSAPTRAFRN